MEDSGQGNSNQTGRYRKDAMKMPQTRYIERSTSMAREKRRLDSASAEEGQPEKKRPAFASVILEALKRDSLQKLCSSLEPILRTVVSEEVERALAKLGPPKLIGRSPPKQIVGSGGRMLQLNFKSRVSLPLFTGGKVEGEEGGAIHVFLTDSITGRIITTGPEASARLDVLVLEGDFNREDDETWTEEDFDSHVVKEREGKRPLLTGELQVTLHEGVGTLGELNFTDNSSWIRSRKFRLGLKVSSGSCVGVRIREAKTEAFNVRDHRGELYKKHYPPALHDEVWRLEKIGKDGSFHKRLNNAGILTVEHFLRLVVRDSQSLRSILGSGMSNKMWDTLLEHSRTCVLSSKLYVYYPDNDRRVGVAFNNIHDFTGLITNGQYCSTDSLPESQKVYVDNLVKTAYENWRHVVEYENQSFLNPEPERSLCNTQINVPVVPQGYSSSFDQQFGIPALPVPVHSDQPALNSGFVGYEHTMSTRYSVPLHNSNLTAQHHFDGSLFAPQNQNLLQQRTRNDNFALDPTQPSTSGYNYHHHDHDHNSFHEQETRMRSHEMLDRDDMQHLLRMLDSPNYPEYHCNQYSSAGGYVPNNAHLSGNFDDYRISSGKAIVGWLKLKAALRWGIFIRKKVAAERRAQLVELE